MTRRHAPAAARNVGPIGDVLADELPRAGLVLELASGSGEHALAFAHRFPDVIWQPSDPDPVACASIAAWREDSGAANLLSPLALDAASSDWPLEHADALLCVNMVHISPWGAAEGLFAGAGRLLPVGAPLVLYGPYWEADVPPAPSNLAFDASLKARDPLWGIRDLSALDDLAEANGLVRSRRVAMPANNLTLVYRKA